MGRNATAWLLVLVGLVTMSHPGRAQVELYDAASELGLGTLIQSADTDLVTGNVAALDLEGDGDLDLLFTDGDGHPRLFRNGDTTPRFFEVTEGSGLDDDELLATAFGVGDFDGDGLSDLWIATDGTDRLLMNQGDGTFLDETTQRLTGRFGPTTTLAVADYDGDGDLDVYVGRYVLAFVFPFHVGDADSLFENDGTGRFHEVTETALSTVNVGNTLAARWTDADADGDLDLLVANDFGCFHLPSRAYRNDGPGAEGPVLVDVSSEWGFDRRVYAMGVGVLDFDGDGFLDYTMSSIGRHLLLKGPPDPSFENATDSAGMNVTFVESGFRVGWAMSGFDLDADGIDELYIRSGEITASPLIRNRSPQSDALLNFAGGTAVNWGPSLPDVVGGQGRGLILANVDSDLDPEWIGGGVNLRPIMMSRGDAGRTVEVRLESTVSAPGAPGAWVAFECEAGRNWRELNGGGLFGSAQAEGITWLTVPQSCTQGQVVVRWPSGISTRSESIGVGETVTLVEPNWFSVSPSEVDPQSDIQIVAEITPYDEDGEPLGAGASVVVNTPSGPIAAAHVGNGVYEAALETPGAGAHRISVSIDGRLMPATRNLRVETPGSPALWLHPTHPVHGRPTTITVFTDGAATELVINDDTLPLSATGSGVYQAEWTPAEGLSEATIQARISGQLSAPWQITVGSRADPSLSRLLAADAVRNGASTEPQPRPVTVQAFVRDANGRPQVEEEEFPAPSVLVDGQDSMVDLVKFANSTWGYPVDDTIATVGDVIRIEADGQMVPGQVTVATASSAEEWLAEVDTTLSRAGFFTESCRGDGQDLLSVSFRFHNSENHIFFPPDSLLSLDVEGGEPINTLVRSGNRVTATIRCDDSVGEGSISLLIGGEDAGLTIAFERTPPPDLDPVDEYTLIEVTAPGPFPVGSTAPVEVYPREATGYLSGSGLELSLVPDHDGLELVKATYCGVGFYCAQLAGPPLGGWVVYRLWVNGAPTSVRRRIWFGEDEPEPFPDAGDRNPSDLGLDAGTLSDLVDDLEAGSDWSQEDHTGDVALSDESSGSEVDSESADEESNNDAGPDQPSAADDEGCGCSQSTGNPLSSLFLGVLVLFAVMRRRRAPDPH
ncbi:MAG: VCBS repeat-containing protein [Myxococcales bacterium]|nr:VCBS repeat-containing protein [Myxococcales bacterium]